MMTTGPDINGPSLRAGHIATPYRGGVPLGKETMEDAQVKHHVLMETENGVRCLQVKGCGDYQHA